MQHRFRPDRQRFAGLVLEALAELPARFRRLIENVAVVVEEWPDREQLRRTGLSERDTLFGLYEGTPLGERGTDYSLQVPDRIVVFRGPLLAAYRDRDELLREIRLTVQHEVGHFFGLPEDELP